MIKTLKFHGAEVRRETPDIDVIWERFFQKPLIGEEREFIVNLAIASSLSVACLVTSETFCSNKVESSRWFARMIHSRIVDPDIEKLERMFKSESARYDNSELRNLVLYDTETLSLFSYNKYALAVIQGVLKIIRVRLKHLESLEGEFFGLPITDNMRKLYHLKTANNAKLDASSIVEVKKLLKTVVPKYVWDNQPKPDIHIESATSIVLRFSKDFFGVRDCAARLVNQHLGNIYIDQALVNFTDIQLYVRNRDESQEEKRVPSRT